MKIEEDPLRPNIFDPQNSSDHKAERNNCFIIYLFKISLLNMLIKHARPIQGYKPADILQIAVVMRQVLFLLLLFLGFFLAKYVKFYAIFCSSTETTEQTQPEVTTDFIGSRPLS